VRSWFVVKLGVRVRGGGAEIWKNPVYMYILLYLLPLHPTQTFTLLTKVSKHVVNVGCEIFVEFIMIDHSGFSLQKSALLFCLYELFPNFLSMTRIYDLVSLTSLRCTQGILQSSLILV
jgi:hypothetical protein